jgi:hypothetical protein
MSIYSQPAFTPLTAASNAIHPPSISESALTKQQTLSFGESVQSTPLLRQRSPSPASILQQQQQMLHTFLENAPPHSLTKRLVPIPENMEIGTSSRPLNELMRDIDVYGELVYVHRVSRLREFGNVCWHQFRFVDIETI